MQEEHERTQARVGWAIAIIIGAIVLVLLLGGGMMGWGMMGPGMMGRYGYSVSPWWSLAMLLFWVLILVGGVLLVLWLLRQSRPAEPGSPSGPRPLAILDERYAKGELTKEQFEQMRHDLTEQP